MQTTHFKYTLKKYKTPSDRVNCPACGGKRTFAPYVDTDTGQDLPSKYGRCNRVDQCGYHLNPYKDEYGSDDGMADNFVPAPLTQQRPRMPAVHLPKNLLVNTMSNSEENEFVRHLSRMFPMEVVNHLVAEYLIGDHNIWPGSTVFWIVNESGDIRAGQVKQFDATGHTAKNSDGTSRTVWIHKLISQDTEWLPAYLDQDIRVDCLFGAHLLPKYPYKKIALFEAPKTAVIAAPFFPDMLCLAVVAMDYLTIERVQALKGRTVILYPDASTEGRAFKKWSEKAEKWQHLASFSTSSYLESTCSDEEKAKGFDFADLLERIPYDENNIESQSVNAGSVENIPHYTALSEGRNETNGSETRAPEKSDFNAPLAPDVHQPKIAETEARVSGQTSIDIDEYRRWAKTLRPFPKGEFVRLSSMVDDSPYNTVFNPRAFAMGRLNSVAAWANTKNDSGPKALHIRQLIELRRILSNNQ